MVNLGNDWDKLLAEEFRKDYYLRLWKFLEGEYRSKHNIYPPKNDIFNALRATSYERTKVVIVGQDPYFNPGEANGLAFSVSKSCTKLPRSLKNIFAEIRRDIKCSMSETNGDLTPWTRQGVLLLNTVLTVEYDKPDSHAKCGWKTFTNRVLEILNEKTKPIVFLLWGKEAQKSATLLNNRHHKILEAPHPSYQAGIKGCKHFSKTNKFLESKGLEEIDWQIPNAK